MDPPARVAGPTTRSAPAIRAQPSPLSPLEEGARLTLLRPAIGLEACDVEDHRPSRTPWDGRNPVAEPADGRQEEISRGGLHEPTPPLKLTNESRVELLPSRLARPIRIVVAKFRVFGRIDVIDATEEIIGMDLSQAAVF